MFSFRGEQERKSQTKQNVHDCSNKKNRMVPYRSSILRLLLRKRGPSNRLGPREKYKRLCVNIGCACRSNSSVEPEQRENRASRLSRRRRPIDFPRSAIFLRRQNARQEASVVTYEITKIESETLETSKRPRELTEIVYLSYNCRGVSTSSLRRNRTEVISFLSTNSKKV